ncbi:hypothetical protein [Streptacidiphilus sp. P02-A3a]|uniref:golvesin C-terminal-like domain-containing protein n=1 Tax=Streptacidiphilus sp. P02-A3a TaxID=2704468 RepID=UPI0015F95F92|nr:hypothetical protein [Streptacidiphilus sp. P02-A3a]QMU69596.1 hypothetical protein GXP74_16480 [Streptacidiphilus sp. P02-A3a]
MWIAVAAALGMLGQSVVTGAASAAVPAPGAPTGSLTGSPTASPTGPGSGASVLTAPDSELGPGWQTSTDRSVTTSGDDNGLQVLAADARSGYQWRTAATLSEPGFDTTQWIGQSCVTSSGRRAVVVYAPREFTNDQQAFDQGSFVAVVDLVTGAVRKLPFTVGLAYYNPGCGSDEQVALTSLSTVGGKTVSTVRLVDAATGRVIRRTTSPGELSSPIPYQGSVAAALGDLLVSVDSRGAEHTLAVAAGTPFRLHPDSGGGLAYQVPVGKQVQVRRFADRDSTLLGTTGLGDVQVAATGSQVFLIGPGASRFPLSAKTPGNWKKLDVPVDAEPSTTGALVVTSSTNQTSVSNAESVAAGAASAATSKATAIPDAIHIGASVTATGKSVSFVVDPAALNPRAGAVSSTAVSGTGGGGTGGGTTSGASGRTGAAARPDGPHPLTTAVDPGTVPWDPDRGCSVPRNNPAIQTYQATAQQVEWAADLAVQGQLTSTRPANWEGSGLPVSWSPQGMFPLRQLTGGGTVPAQVLLGILAQESNTMQASPHAVDSITGNVNQGGFYGNGQDWSTVDCGYGVGQVTTGMAMSTPAGTPVADGNTAYTTAEQQQAIATDYASNIAATLNLLIDKWNELKAAGIVAGNGDPRYVENWWFAVWAYNSGVEPGTAAFGNTTGCLPGPTCTDNGGSGGNWGLGWANNPANPSYPADRGVFTDSATDTKTPNHWTYPELVMGWAFSPVVRFNYVTGGWAEAYAAASGGAQQPTYPPLMSFCSSVDNCTPDAAADSNGTANSAGLCGLANNHCWWHYSASWVTCGSTECGTANATYTSSSAKPVGTDIYPADCRTLGTGSGSSASDSTGAAPPAGSIVVDDTGTPSVASCNQTWTDQGSFGLTFADAPPACGPTPCSDPIDYPAKIDFHQLGVGFGGHIWFTHTQPTSDSADSVTGTWTPPAINGWTRVFVHVPDNGMTTQQAGYLVTPGAGQKPETRYVNADLSTNDWVSLGVFDFDSAQPESVSLSNLTADGDGTADIAWDSVAFQVLPSKPTAFVVQMGDSYSSGEGTEPYQPGTDVGPHASESSQSSLGESWNACRRSQNSWIRDTVLPSVPSANLGTLADDNAAALDLHSVACSGAYTFDMDPKEGTPNNWGELGNYHEVQQLSSGYLDDNTTLVALTIGGNDIGFSDDVEGCAELDSCPSTTGVENSIKKYMAPVTDPTSPTYVALILTDIHIAAPHAKIVLLGYPDIFDGSTVNSCTTSVMSPDAMTQLNSWGDYLATAEAAMVASLPAADNVTFVNPSTEFNGYEDCGHIANGINDFVSAPTGPGDFSCPVTVDPRSWVCASMESFHPDNSGTPRYAMALEAALQ